MPDDYLWDRAGAPDADVERLERALGRYRLDPSRMPAVALPAVPASVRTPSLSRPLLAAAGIMLFLAGALFLRREARATWRVAAGMPASAHETRELRDGDTIVTGGTRQTLVMGDVGQVALGQETRVRLDRSGARGHRLTLLQGRIDAVTNAPPRLFVVETPIAVATDLGCIYSMDIDASGAGTLHVAQGLVAIEQDGRSVFIPAGATVSMSPGRAPGTPVNDLASPALRDAVARLDAGVVGSARAQALEVALRESVAGDLVTLWHLLEPASAAERAGIHDRMAALRGGRVPVGVTRAGITGGSKRMLNRWRDELGIVDPLWWRVWKFSWAFAW